MTIVLVDTPLPFRVRAELCTRQIGIKRSKKLDNRPIERQTFRSRDSRMEVVDYPFPTYEDGRFGPTVERSRRNRRVSPPFRFAALDLAGSAAVRPGTGAPRSAVPRWRRVYRHHGDEGGE